MAMVVARFGGATCEEIGQEYGITRERARQLIQRAGVTAEMLEDRPLFTSKKKVDVRGVLQQLDAKAAKSAAYHAKVHDRRHLARAARVAQLKALAVELGRTPTMTELAASQGFLKNSTCVLTGPFATWTYGRRKTPYGVRSARLYRAAGLPAPQVGGAGHLRQIDWKAERRAIVRVARQMAAVVGGRPPVSAIAALTRFWKRGGHGVTIAFTSYGGNSRTSYRDAARRLYRAAGILPPYGWAPSLDQRHGAY